MQLPALPKPSKRTEAKQTEGRRGKLAYCGLCVLVALVSAAVLSPHFSSAETYRDIYQTLDERQNNVLSLAFGSALISSVISALPDDMGTSLSSEYADFYTGFAVVVAALLLEKYLLTTIGFGFFTIIIPVCCLLFISARLSPPFDSTGYKRRQMAMKLLVFGLTLFVMTPLSVFVSKQIDDSYRASVEKTIETTEEAKKAIEDKTGAEEEEEEVTEEGFNPVAVVQKQISNTSSAVGGAIDAVGGFATSIIPWAINQLRTYAELFAVMVVTSIVIPVLVPVIAYLMFKILFLSDNAVTIPAPLVEALSSTGSALSGATRPTLAQAADEGTSATPVSVQEAKPSEGSADSDGDAPDQDA